MAKTAAPGETDLSQLLRSLNPVLSPQTFVWGSIPAKSASDYANILKLFVGINVQLLFRESGSWTVVVPQDVAKEIQLESTFPCRMVTLDVHSSLEAVGFIAAISARLTKIGVGANTVAGFYHDHLFVAPEKAEEVVKELKKMAAEQGGHADS